MTAPFTQTHIESLVQALPQPALIIAAGGTVLAANAAAIDTLEANPTGQHLAMALRAPAILQAVTEALSTGTARQAEHTTRSPVPRTLSVQVARLGVAEDDSALALLLLHDATYADQVERMRTDFVANASHELRTPLASISGFIETMQGAARNDEPARERFLGLMQAQAQRMSRLIDDLLSLSRIETNEHVQPTDHVDLARIARQAIELLAPVAQAAHCTIRAHLPATLMVRGDAGQLSQVAHNFIENAIRYAGENLPIDVTVSDSGGMASLAVADHGPGIAAHHVPRLTERFYRVNAQDSRRRGGTGLGLAIAKHIANRHRGRLSIASKPGEGSTFTLTLPMN